MASGIRVRFWPVSFPKGGRVTLLSTSRLGPHAASAGLPVPQAHTRRGPPTCLLSFPVALPLRASASPSAHLRLALKRRGRRKCGRGFICAQAGWTPPQPAGASLWRASVPWRDVQKAAVVSSDSFCKYMAQGKGFYFIISR